MHVSAKLLLNNLDIRKTKQMLANFFHRIWILEKKNTILLIIKKHSAFFLSVLVAFPNFCVNMMLSRLFDPFSCKILGQTLFGRFF